MTRYLLDTNILSDLVRNPQGKAAQRIEALGEDAVCTSIIVAAELRFGVAKAESPKLHARVESLLDRLEIHAFESPADAAYADIRARLEASGNAIGANDTLIAAHAVALDCVVVTDNDREFRRVPGLAVENWLRGS